jgi:hypothetical protein
MLSEYSDFKRIGFDKTIRYKGVLNFDDFYGFIANWIRDHDFDFNEKSIIDQPPYIIYKMEGRKKINYIVMLKIMPEIHVKNKKKIQIISERETKIVDKVEMKVIVNGGVILDYDNDFNTHNMKKAGNFLYDKVLYQETYTKYVENLDYYLHDFATSIKKYLEMESATNAYQNQSNQYSK